MDIDYEFDGEVRRLHVSDGDSAKPLVVLLHGTAGDVRDMTDPAASPGHNYDSRAALRPDRDVGWRGYPGVGVWSFELDGMKDVRSWRDALAAYGFRTAAYSQVDSTGFLARPVRELATVVGILRKNLPEARLVLLAQSRGGLLARQFLKDEPDLATRIDKLITLHTPHGGSELANVAVALRAAIQDLQQVAGGVATTALGWLLDIVDSDAYKELAVGSAFLRDLGEDPPSGIDCFTFGGTSVRLTRVLSWVYTLSSALPQFHWPPFHHEITLIEVPLVSPVADSLPNLVDEIANGRGDLLTADARTRFALAPHRTNSINHAESLWDLDLQAQVLAILGESGAFWE